VVKYSDVQTVKTAYYGYVYSKLKYGVLPWGCSFKENIDRVFKKQKNIIRINNGANRNTSCRELFISMKVLTVQSMIILTNCLEVQKNIKSLKKGAPAEYNLRERYKIPPTNNKIRNFQINLCNNILNKIKVLPLKDFKSELNRVLFENAFYLIEEFTEFFYQLLSEGFEGFLNFINFIGFSILSSFNTYLFNYIGILIHT